MQGEYVADGSKAAGKIEFAERKPRPAGNSFEKVTGTFTVSVQTQHVIWKLREDPLNDEQRTRADAKLLFVRAT
jgi:hypothetical protein